MTLGLCSFRCCVSNMARLILTAIATLVWFKPSAAAGGCIADTVKKHTAYQIQI